MIDQITEIREALQFMGKELLYRRDNERDVFFPVLEGAARIEAALAALAAMPQPVEVSEKAAAEMVTHAIKAYGFGDAIEGPGVIMGTHSLGRCIVQQLLAAGVRIIKEQPTKAPSESEGA